MSMPDGMASFGFRTVSSIEVAWGGSARLGPVLKERLDASRVLLVTDAGLRAAGVLDPALASLEEAGLRVRIFDAVVADPPEEVLLECVRTGCEAGADLVLGLGGGSSMDVAKLTAVLIRGRQPLAELYGIDKVKGGRLPLVQVPTTAGTGSEVTNISILTTGATTKMGVVAPQLFADHVLLDASLTVGLPALHTAASGIDAMVHAIEAYTSRIRKNPLSDALAREALRLLAANLVTACRDGGDRAAREAMLLGAMLAGQAFTNAPVGAVHALAYPLGGHYHVPHGLSNALMLGPVLRFNAGAAGGLYGELAPLVGAPAGTAQSFIERMEDLMNASGAPRRLRDAGIEEDKLPLLAADAMKQTRLLVNNPVELTSGDALSLYREAF